MKVDATGDRIRIEIDLSVAPDRTWDLFAEKEHRKNWWGDHVTLDVKLGGKLRETWSDGERRVITSGEVTRCEPPVTLEMTWADDDWPDHTEVAFRLSEHEGGTRLRLEHSGWRVHPEGERKRLVDAHTSGWAQYLGRLAEYAVTAGSST